MTVTEAKTDLFSFIQKNLTGKKFYESNFNEIPDDEQFMRIYCQLLTGQRSGIGTDIFRRQGVITIAVFTPITKGLTPHTDKVEESLKVLNSYENFGKLTIYDIFATDLGKDPNADLTYTNVQANYFFEGD